MSWRGAKFAEDMNMSRRHFCGRHGALCVLAVWKLNFCGRLGVVRLRLLVEVNVAVTLGLACGRVKLQYVFDVGVPCGLARPWWKVR